MKTLSIPQPTMPRIAYHAQYGATYGMAIRDERGAVWFLDDQDTLTALTDADLPALMLFGRVDIAAHARVDDLAREAVDPVPQEVTMTVLTGNTYKVKDQLKRLGACWDAAAKHWTIDATRAAEAQAVIDAETYTSGSGVWSSTWPPRTRTCKTCGCRIKYGAYCGKCEYAH
jgi:hypothetical protein